MTVQELIDDYLKIAQRTMRYIFTQATWVVLKLMM